MIFQDPMTSLNPVLTIGDQIGEAVKVHNPGTDDEAARKRVVELLELVGVPFAERRVDQYPHEFSGGMRQRAMIAMAIANDPAVLIADEPTTALDVTIQAQIVEVLRAAREETHAAIILITHDLGLIAELADRVVVMYAGNVVELSDVVHDLQRAAASVHARAAEQPGPRSTSTRSGCTRFPVSRRASSRCRPAVAFHPRCELLARPGRLPDRLPGAAPVRRGRRPPLAVSLRRGARGRARATALVDSRRSS